MCSTKRRGASLNSIIPYTLPKLHTGKNWYIDFKAYDPLEQKMKRKKYMLDSIDKISVRKKRATELIANISRQLLSGWNPWADTSNSRQYTLFDDIDRKSTRLNSVTCLNLVCRLLLEKKSAIYRVMFNELGLLNE